MANSDLISWIQAGEPLNGTGLEGAGQPDVLNRPIKDLLEIFETGQADFFSTKTAIKVLDNNEFVVGVTTGNVVMLDLSTGKFMKAVPNKFRVVGFADLTNSLILAYGVRDMTPGSLLKGQMYYLSKTQPGVIVPQSSADKSYVIVGLAVTNSKLFVNINIDIDLVDDSVAMAIALGG